MSKLFAPTRLGKLALSNSIVMAPLTRSRSSPEGLVLPHVVEYYKQRATAGLIIAEGTQPSYSGQGYCRTPGCHTDEQVAAWKKVTDAVHAQHGKIVLQIMHVGRIAHPLNRLTDAQPIAPSAIKPAGEMYTDAQQMQPFPMPRALETSEIPGVIDEFVHASRCAIAAGFDGVEVHGANGYLLDQFLCSSSNQRTDGYGGSVGGRIRLVAETVEAVAAAIGVERTGLRLSPGHMFNDVKDEAPMDTAKALLDAIPTADMAYVHLMLADAFAAALSNAGDASTILPTLRPHAKGALLAAGNLDKTKAEELLGKGLINAAVFGRPFISNPDLVRRLKEGLPLAEPKPELFYTPGPEGYSDYPAAK
jgi:N-ethylmaleimide reductase